MEEILNSPITADEINSVVQKLKNAGSDNIVIIIINICI
jgi:hypothetical protein